MRSSRLVALLLLLLLLPAAAPAQDAALGAKELEEIRTLMEGHTDRSEESRILDLLTQARPAVLDAIVRGVDLPTLFSDIDDRPFGPDNRTKLLKLLTKGRLAALSVEARAAVLDGLARGSTDALAEVAIRDVFLGTTGRELTRLKCLVDEGGDYHDLEQLVFHDLDDADLQGEVLGHFAAQAREVGAAVKVLSDIDDTLYCNWVDARFPKKAVYPGVRALHRELDRGPGDAADRLGDLTFLTARPADRAGVVEDETIATLKGLGVDPPPQVLGGDFSSLHSNEVIAAKKLENFKLYRRLFPEYSFVFTGDSGQGDAIAGAGMVEAAGAAVKVVLIHDVVASTTGVRDDWRKKGVIFFDTWVGAACVCLEKGLISKAGLSRVVEAARSELAAIEFDDKAKRAARVAELDRDVARAQALVAAATPPPAPATATPPPAGDGIVASIVQVIPTGAGQCVLVINRGMQHGVVEGMTGEVTGVAGTFTVTEVYPTRCKARMAVDAAAVGDSRALTLRKAR
jgi:hypothetical protein